VTSHLRPFSFPLSLGVLMLATAWVHGCNTPVFRYALERWDASPYVVVVCHNGPLTPEQEKRVAAFLPADGESPQPNLELSRLDLSNKDDAFRAQLEELLGEPLTRILPAAAGPQVLILFPIVYARKGVVFWTGPLEAPELKGLADSPVRRDLARHLLLGHAAVWLQVESGDAEADRKT